MDEESAAEADAAGAADLAPTDLDVVLVAELGAHSEALQPQHRSLTDEPIQLPRTRWIGQRFFSHDELPADLGRVAVDGAAAGEAPVHFYATLAAEVQIQLFLRVLVVAEEGTVRREGEEAQRVRRLALSPCP